MGMLFYILQETRIPYHKYGCAAEIPRVLGYRNSITVKDFVSDEIFLPRNFSMS